MKNIWSTNDVYIDNCGKYDNQIFNVMLSQDVFIKINILMKKYPRLEWLAYLIGDFDYNKRTAYVKDLIIPDQEVGVAKVYNIGMIEEKSIGVIHSHHHMGNFFSQDDKTTINENNDISLLVTHKKITGQVRIKTECGCYYNMKAKIEYDLKHDIIIEDFLKNVDEKITERKEKNERQLVKNKVNGNGNHISRTQVNRDEDGRDLNDNLFDPREDDNHNLLDDLLEDLDNEDSWSWDEEKIDDCKKVLTYEDLINSDDESYEEMLQSDLDYLIKNSRKV